MSKDLDEIMRELPPERRVECQINAMGGSLKLVAEFPDRPPVILDGLAELSEDENQAQSLDTSEPENVFSSEQSK